MVVIPSRRIDAFHKKSKYVIVSLTDVFHVFLGAEHETESQRIIPWDKIKLKHCDINYRSGSNGG